jgi:hypothetical protein
MRSAPITMGFRSHLLGPQGLHEKGGVQMPTCKTRTGKQGTAPVKKAAAKPVKAAKKKK